MKPTLTALFAFIASALFAQAGTLDSSFGMDGKVLTDISLGNLIVNCAGALIQNDGKILAFGKEYGNPQRNPDIQTGFFLARYFSNGLVDTDFGIDGQSVNDLDKNFLEAYSAAMQSDGKIIICGYERSGSLYKGIMERFKADGTLDSSFGSGGLVLNNYSSNVVFSSVNIDADNRIVATGTSNSLPIISRYTQEGQIDSSFGNNGNVIVNISATINCSSIQKDGKILIGGVTGTAQYENFLLVRYLTTGKIDSSFGKNGYDIIDFSNGNADQVNCLQVLSNNIIVAAGVSYTTTNMSGPYNMAVAVLKSNGKLYNAFGNKGKATVTFPNENSSAYCVLVQKDNKILLGGTSGEFSITRLNYNGSLDSSFGVNGKTTTKFAQNGFSTIYSIILQGNEILTAGDAAIFYDNIGMAKYYENSSLQDKNIALAENNKLIKLSIFPNPVKDILTVNSLSSINKYQLEIINANGNVVANKKVSNVSSYQLNVQSLSAGVYYINIISNNNQTSVLKFLKE